ncbi:MAG TPA: diaminopimelate epimerase [Bacillota bacterium]|nr:diaminopimelate epimerase [Bacillota bacterium]
MKFTKMHGLGNDYIYLNCFETQIKNPEQLAVQMSDRHFGIGGDGLVLIMPSDIADAKMRMFNADGSEAEMCGNAIRCVAKYLYDYKLVIQETFQVETLAGIKTLTVEIANSKVASVRVDMGEPILENNQIPVLAQKAAVNLPIEVNGNTYHFTAVSMGNPHCIVFVPEITEAMVFNDGPTLEIHPLFPKKTNVEFVTVSSPNQIQMRVWERGSGETLACGTGSCASVVAAVLNGLTSRQVNVRLLGGDLRVEWDEATNHVFMTGPAFEVFTGEWLGN